MVRTAALYRLSSMKQVRAQRHEEGDTLPGQKAAVRRFLEARPDWELLPEHEYEEPGVSAFKKRIHERPVLVSILDAAKAGEFDALCVFREDRLSRGDEDSGAELLYILSELERNGVHVWSVADQKHLTVKGTQLVIRAVEADTANQESKKTSARVRNGRTTGAEEGRWTGGRLSFGYMLRARLDGNNQPVLRGGRVVNDIVPHPDYAPVVREIFQRYLRGDGTPQIAAWLNASGMPSFSGKGWDANGIKHLLCNRFYVGDVALHHSWHSQKNGEIPILSQGSHEPIIGVDTFERVQAHRETRKRVPSRQLGAVYALGGVAYCACGARLGGITRTKATKHGLSVYKQQYRCRQWVMQGSCPEGTKHLDAEEVEANFVAAVERHYLDPAGILTRLQERHESQATKLRDEQESRRRMQDRIKEIDAALKRVDRAYFEANTLTDAQYAEKKDAYVEERKGLVADLAKPLPRFDQQDFAPLAAAASEIRKNWEYLSLNTAIPADVRGKRKQALAMQITEALEARVVVQHNASVDLVDVH